MIPLNSNLSQLQRSAIRRFTNLARQTPDCAMLTIGEPDFDTPEQISCAAWEALQAGQTHYAPNQGTDSLREAITDFENRRGMHLTKERVLVTVGASEALFLAIFGVLNPGDEVIIPTPAFPLYETLTRIAGAKPVWLDTGKTDFQIREEALQAVLTPRTKAIILNSPNNPTGVVLDETSMEAVKRVLGGKPVYLICDHVYQQLTDGPCPDLARDETLKDQVLMCQSFSKPYAMTGWRVGYLAGPVEVMERLLLLHAGTVAAVPTFVQSACMEALQTDTTPMIEAYRRRREYVCQRLDEMGLSYPQPRGAFYVFPRIAEFGIDSEEFCTRMIREGGVAAVPGSCFRAEGYIRLSCCYSEDALKLGLDRMEAFLEKLKEG